jgi:carboxypeptidase family protein
MFPRAIIIAVVATVLLAAGSTFAGDKKEGKDELVIKGKVIGDNGKPEPEAEIRVKRADGKGPESVALTDSRGQYIVVGLKVSDYTVTAYDPNGFARSRALIKPSKKGWANVNFDLGLDKAQGDGADRMWQGALHGHLTNPNSHGAPISTTQ